jgi:hypothetical protein
MKYLKSTVLKTLFITPILLSGVLNAQYANPYQNNGNLQVEVQSNGYNSPRMYSDRYAERNGAQNNSETNNIVCYAIKHQKRLEITVETQELLNKREVRIVTKKYIVEPYAFGMTNEGKPVFYGNVSQNTLDNEVNIKYGVDKFDDQAVTASSQKVPVTSGWFGSENSKSWFGNDKNSDIDIKNIKGVRVIEDSHFDAPKEYAGYVQPNVQIVCQLPITKQVKQ